MDRMLANERPVLYQCSLKRDLSLFDAGDATEIGEKGLTLSGGQKARIALARAIYSSAKVILLDDILAALDVHTSVWIVNKCLKGDLIKGRTVLLVTHNVALASPIADYVVSMGTDGRIVSQGVPTEALVVDRDLAEEISHEQEAIELEEELEEADDNKAVSKGSKVIWLHSLDLAHMLNLCHLAGRGRRDTPGSCFLEGHEAHDIEL
jgi:ABC-type methionine transport system ATPase subunit